jgi:hypothetical protein
MDTPSCFRLIHDLEHNQVGHCKLKALVICAKARSTEYAEASTNAFPDCLLMMIPLHPITISRVGKATGKYHPV